MAWLFVTPLFSADRSQLVSVIMVDDHALNAVELYQVWSGEPVAFDRSMKAAKSPINLKLKNVEKETALKLLAEALRTQAGISIERDADGHLKTVVLSRPVKP